MATRWEAPEPVIASPKPYYCEIKAGRSIAWCRCGRSKHQPFCDGRSHLGTGFEPLLYKVGAEQEEVLLCGCKHTRTPPFCDGAHNNLPGGYLPDQRTEGERSRVPRAAADAGGVKQLDGTCYVVTPDATRPPTRPLTGARFWQRPIIAPSLGARYQSLFYLEVDDGASPALGAGPSTVILFIAQGKGTVVIADRAFEVTEGDGVHVRAGETFQFQSEGALRAFASALPGIEALDELPASSAVFEATLPQRVRGVDAAQRCEMGPRYFQMLVDKDIGASNAAQFIGHIPMSRAEMHRHLYEEALMILSGEGMMWTEQTCATVRSGDVIFLPSKQVHSLECIHPDGMDVVGIIFPGDNPSINY